jgi:signal transduction histidine kinase
MSESRFASPTPASSASNSPHPQTRRQSLGLVDRPCTESELLQHLREGEAARQELDQQARQLVSLAEHSATAACLPEAAFQDKGGFLDSLSGEMRTPLNGIIGMTDVLRSKQLPKSARDCVEAIRQSGDALLAIADNVHDFSKIEGGRMQIERAEFELASLLAQSIQIVRNAASRKFLTIRTHVDPALPPVVSGDVVRVRQIVLNLLSNAIRFTSEGEIELRAELRATTRKELEIYFSVKDNGIGIVPQQQAHLFQPFGSANESTAGGLGLAICKRLAELMGGAIGVTSSQGAGSLFWFTILAGRSKQNSRYVVRSS